MRPFRTAIVALLFASASITLAQSDEEPTSSITTIRSSSASATKSTDSPSTVILTATPSETTRESSEYYPPGQSYDDPYLGGEQPVNDKAGGGAGKSDAFMGAGVGAQIGIIAAVVVVAIALFLGIVIYYFRRKKQWEKEVKRRSALPMNAKLVVLKTGEVKLADRSSSASKVGLEELEKGGVKVGNIEGERKPGVIKMLLGKF